MRSAVSSQRPSSFTPRRHGLPPHCYTPTPSAIRAEAAARLLRRGIATLIELACIGMFLAAVLIWAAIGAGA